MARVEDQHWWYAGMRSVTAALLDRVIDHRSDVRILDAGCGTGANLSFLRRFGSTSGLDLSFFACDRSKRRGAGSVLRGSVAKLPYKSESFDVVTSFEVLCNVSADDQKTALLESFRVLRPGGWMVLRLPAFSWLRRRHDVRVHALRRYRRSDVRELLRGRGFLLEQLTYVNCILLPVVVLQVILERLRWSHDRGSDLFLPSPFLNRLLRAPLEAERFWIQHGGGMPVGVSVLAVARKPL